MTETDLLAVINEAEADMHLNKVFAGSPGFTHIRELYGKLKADKDMQNMLCNLFKINPLKLPEIFASVDHALVLEDGLLAHTDQYTALLDRLKTHDWVLKAIAKIIG